MTCAPYYPSCNQTTTSFSLSTKTPKPAMSPTPTPTASPTQSPTPTPLVVPVPTQAPPPNSSGDSGATAVCLLAVTGAIGYLLGKRGKTKTNQPINEI